jgi:hypothetical protein
MEHVVCLFKLHPSMAVEKKDKCATCTFTSKDQCGYFSPVTQWE